jgi:UDP-3-O-[3-hydroxymyristoyl] glucosamine N-acyltransferase
MVNKRFFLNQGPFLLKDLIAATNAKLVRDADLNLQIDDLAPLENAKNKELSFFVNRSYLSEFSNSNAGFCFVLEKDIKHAPSSMILLVHEHPHKAYAIATNLFYPNSSNIQDIAKTAYISEKAILGNNCKIGQFVVIEDDVVISDNTIIEHNSVIKSGVIIGANAKIHSNVTISHSIIGDNVIIHPGAKIGQDGFGFASDHTGHMKIQQLGIVRIGNNVEIGANTTIDRGSIQDTVIGDMCQIDNLVQLGHNVKLGTACVIVAQVGIAGSSKLGNFTVLGGQVGVAGHLNIGSQVQIAAQSGVVKDVADKQKLGGSPAVPIRQWHKQNYCLNKLVKNSNIEE